MPNFPRTDLAVEAEALRSAAAAAQLPGVRAAQTQRRGFAVTQPSVPIKLLSRLLTARPARV